MPTPELLQQSQLKRMRAVALALLLLMVLLLMVALRLEVRHPSWSYVATFAEAAMVGGLADWFAVSALFRHPLGLPIPHTAIIPNNKERIGESIGNFLQHNFMTQEVLREELAQVDFAGAGADWLAHEDNSAQVARQLADALPPLLRTLDDARVRELLRAALAGSVGSVRLGPALAQLLNLLIAGRQHHILFERILGIVARALEQNRPYIRQKVHENSPRWLPRAIDEKLFARILEGVQGILIEIQAEDSEWRTRFDQATADMIERLASSDDYERKLHALLERGVGNPAFQRYIADVWNALKERLLADAQRDDSHLAARAALLLRSLGDALRNDPAMRARINAWLRAVVADTIAERRDVIAAVVWRIIRKWDGATVSRKFELQVGKDLQYIRINGTLVGGTVGVLLHALAPLLRN
jgi:uncharacterized membrane-anchored protein YjiN (DUF445 family)